MYYQFIISDASVLKKKKKNFAQVLYREDHVPEGEHHSGALFPER